MTCFLTWAAMVCAAFVVLIVLDLFVGDDIDLGDDE